MEVYKNEDKYPISNCNDYEVLFDPKYQPNENESIVDIGIPMEEDLLEFSLGSQDHHFNNQNYDDILMKLKKNNKLFVDSSFPPNDSSIFIEPHSRRSFVQWIRASEMVENPKFITEGATRFDINQGRLGDCWFLAAVGNLTLKPKLFERIVSVDQNFEDSYGMFRFKFFQFGEWVDVVVDDYLPTLNGRLIFMKSDSSNEFWSSLLEKAYAKLNGCYQALSGGLINEAMVDFSGGCPEHYDFTDPDKIPQNMFEIMQEAKSRNSMMGAGIMPHSNVYENRLDNGLVQGHAYSVTGIATMSTTNGEVDLVRIRNPWGNFMEWKGPWSDGSSEWKTLSQKDRDRLNYEENEDGEFFMAKNDFLQQFDFLEICHLTNDSFDEKNSDHGKSYWHKKEFHGNWIVGKTAGGCANNFASFVKNPQFKLILKDGDQTNGMTTVIVSLMQKDFRRCKGSTAIGFVIYRAKENQQMPLKMDDLLNSEVAGFTLHYYNAREVNKRFQFENGIYIIIPTTFEPGTPGEFLLRVFSEKSPELHGYEEFSPSKNQSFYFSFA